MAEFAARNLEDVLRGTQNFKMKNYDLALQDAFLRIDDMLMTPNGKKQLLQIQ